MPETKTILEIRSAAVRFARGKKQQPARILEDITLDLRDDEIVAIIGPNGCGKSTLLRLVAGLIPPTKGEIRHHRKKLKGLNHDVAMVFQNFALIPWMTVEENIKVVLRAQEYDEDEVSRRTEKALKQVGLEGFEEAYPRELSRGAKQRVGLARALSVEPEILIMDEPFSQVDALTAEALRAEIHDIWKDTEVNPSCILLVSHSIREALLMADRVVVMGGNPGTIRTVVDVPLARPRDAHNPMFLRLVDHIHDIITSSELPDVQIETVKSGFEPDGVEPLPRCSSTDILGLIEFVDSHGGKSDLFQVASHNQIPFEDLLRIVKGAEMLELVETPKRMVELTAIGRRFVNAGNDERKDLWKAQLLDLRLFRIAKELLEQREGSMHKEELVQELATRLPTEDPEATFQTLIGWARFGELFAYREEQETITFD